jgi:GntR family transcriptional repressor for pyruvate dehydrogenase complex
MKKKTMYFNPIRNKRSFDEVSTEIKKMIIEGTLRVGDKLPSELVMASQFNVGRQTIREALRFLELSGFLTVQKGGGGGSVITNSILNTITKSFLDAVQMRNISVIELTTARLDIEKLVVRHAITQITEDDCLNLNENIDKAAKKIALGIQAFEENVNFHILLAKASKNGVLIIVVESIMAIVSDFLSHIPQTVAISEKVLNNHRDILQALMERDEERAVELLCKDLRDTDIRFKSSFKQMNKPDRKRGNEGRRPKVV